MKRVSKKRAALMKDAGPWRYSFKEEVGRCEVCLKRREPIMLAVHEIARGQLRQKCLMARFGVLVVCAEPNWRTGVDCHASIQNWKEPKQLALLYLVRAIDYDLEAYNALVNPRAPNRITQDEVNVFIESLTHPQEPQT